MDMLDIVALLGLEWVFDKVEDRYGRAAAWIVTTGLAVAFLGAIVTALVVETLRLLKELGEYQNELEQFQTTVE
jgi:hypothetical protein